MRGWWRFLPLYGGIPRSKSLDDGDLEAGLIWENRKFRRALMHTIESRIDRALPCSGLLMRFDKQSMTYSKSAFSILSCLTTWINDTMNRWSC